MPLTCRKHEKRSVVLLSGAIVHRSDPSNCGDSWVNVGSRLLSSSEVLSEIASAGRLRKIVTEPTTEPKRKRKP